MTATPIPRRTRVRRGRGASSEASGTGAACHRPPRPARQSGPVPGASGQTGPVTTDVLADLEARGLVHQTTDREALAAPPRRGPGLRLLRLRPDRRQPPHRQPDRPAGAAPAARTPATASIGLAGGATGMVGDPSGRSDERNLLDDETLAANTAAISAQIARVVDPDGTRRSPVRRQPGVDRGPDPPRLPPRRRQARHRQPDGARDSVRARLDSEQGISYTEFSYMLLQAHDYLHLHRSLGVELQIGGSDQWGNIVSGVDLVRRVDRPPRPRPVLAAADRPGRHQAGQDAPAAGSGSTRPAPAPTSSSSTGAGRRRPARAPPALVHPAPARPRSPSCSPPTRPTRAPARPTGPSPAEVTTLVHGEEAARTAEGAARHPVRGRPDRGLAAAELEVVAGEVPAVDLDLAGDPTTPRCRSCCTPAGVAKSSSEARRAIDQGGVYAERGRASRATGR